MNLSRQIRQLAAVPLAGLAVLSGILFSVELNEMLAAQRTKVAVEEASQLSTLIHSLQVERGQSAGFIASGGKNFVATLPDMRDTTDAAIGDLTGQFDELRTRLLGLQEKRGEVDGTLLTVPEMASWYTGTIRIAIQLKGGVILNSPNPEVVRLGAGIQALTEAKEAAGLKRASGATGLGAGTFAEPVYRGFLARDAIERSMLSLAISVFGPLTDDVDFEAARDESGVRAFRDAIIGAGVGNAPSGITAPEWFAASTAWIEFLRGVESDLSGDIASIANRSVTESLIWLVAVSVLSIASIVACVKLSLRVSRNFMKSMNGLTGFLNRLARRDFEARQSKEDLNSEIGELFVSIDNTREALFKADQELKASEAERVNVIEEMQQALDRLADGDLSCAISGQFPEAYRTLQDRFNATVNNLSGTMSGLNRSVTSFEASSSELGNLTDDMSRRTNSQAASLEETTAALTEMANSVAQAASVAKETSGQTQDLRDEATSGREQIDRAIPVMEEISKAAEKMSGMVTMIDDIAFQTNLLALNAGVEAARAGDAGRGFAVVASEVRSLAAKAGATASDIKELIQKTNATIGSGVKMVGSAVEAFSKIDESVSTVTGSVERLTDDARVQASRVAEIRAAMESLDQVTQKNAAMVDQCAQMAIQLGDQATKVKSLAGEFQTERRDEPPLALGEEMRVA